eukprot:COSAG01_NODE_2575_length_7433_cov_10.052495_2_plen_244_part_00
MALHACSWLLPCCLAALLTRSRHRRSSPVPLPEPGGRRPRAHTRRRTPAAPPPHPARPTAAAHRTSGAAAHWLWRAGCCAISAAAASNDECSGDDGLLGGSGTVTKIGAGEQFPYGSGIDTDRRRKGGKVSTGGTGGTGEKNDANTMLSPTCLAALQFVWCMTGRGRCQCTGSAKERRCGCLTLVRPGVRIRLHLLLCWVVTLPVPGRVWLLRHHTSRPVSAQPHCGQAFSHRRQVRGQHGSS